MSLSKLFDDLDNLITNKRPVSEIKPILTLLRDQTEALEAEHTTLSASYAALEKEKLQIDQELACIKKIPPGGNRAYTPPGF